MQSPERAPGHHRRTRLLKLLEREHDKSRAAAYCNSLRGARSLPSLHHQELRTARSRGNDDAFQSPSSIAGGRPKKLVAAPAAYLSPLKCRARASAAAGNNAGSSGGHGTKSSVLLTAQTSGLFNLCDALEQSPAASAAREADDKRAVQRVDEQQSEPERQVARDIQRAQLEQIAGRQLRRREREVDGLVLREQLEWELAQADTVQQQLEAQAASECARHAQHLRLALEAQQLLAVVRATAAQFVESLAFRPAAQALEILERDQDALVGFCLDKCRAALGVTRVEREQIQTELMEQLARAHADLESRRQSEEREQRLELERKRVLLDVQETQRAQMARRRDAESRRRDEAAAAGVAVKRAQDAADRRATAASAVRKERALDNEQRVITQIHNKQAARRLFPLRVEGCSSPVCRTPWWSDESEEQRLDGFARKDAASELAVGAASPAIVAHPRRSATWYD